MDLKIDQERIEQAIIVRAVYEILGGDEQIDSRVYSEVERQVKTALEKTLNAKVDQALNDALHTALEAEIQPVNIFGEREGKPTTIRATLHERAKNFWNETVNSKGEKATSSDKPRWEYVLSIITAKEFESAIKQDVINVAAAIKDSVRKTFYAEVDAKLNDYFKVKSLEDQTRGK